MKKEVDMEFPLGRTSESMIIPRTSYGVTKVEDLNRWNIAWLYLHHGTAITNEVINYFRTIGDLNNIENLATNDNPLEDIGGHETFTDTAKKAFTTSHVSGREAYFLFHGRKIQVIGEIGVLPGGEGVLMGSNLITKGKILINTDDKQDSTLVDCAEKFAMALDLELVFSE